MSAELKEVVLKEANNSHDFDDFEAFQDRHIGPSEDEVEQMLATLGLRSLEELVEKTVPAAIRLQGELGLEARSDEYHVLAELKRIASKNQVYRSYIGQGFYNTITPPVILRNIMENPGWYTQYTPYQAEISQGRLEALINYQTLVAELCGLDMANSSLLDEASAAAEAMTLSFRQVGSEKKNKYFVDQSVHPSTLAVLATRAAPLGLELIQGEFSSATLDENVFGAIVQYPSTDGVIHNFKEFAASVHAQGGLLTAACDLLALVLLESPGSWGADIAIGNSQRFGVPLGFGGPHAAFMACKEAFKRDIPGRMVGVSKDAQGNSAYRLALQTREQHIKRERATSNICTAQVLLAIMAGTYAVYHGPDGLKKIATRVHQYTALLASGLTKLGIELLHNVFFDTLRTAPLAEKLPEILKRADAAKINFRKFSDGSLGISLDETVSLQDIEDILAVFSEKSTQRVNLARLRGMTAPAFAAELERKDTVLEHPVFHSHRSETEMLRYLHRLQAKDLSLTTSMIPLGSCTMKLNATVEMLPVTWPEFSSIHPFAPKEQTQGYRELVSGLEGMLAEITGLPGVSLQPNAGSVGEYAGLLSVRDYHQANGQGQRNVCLIPQSAHGTNPASAILAGMKVVPVKCDDQGNIDLQDLEEKAKANAENLAALMVTYPSTHGVFEEGIKEICALVHSHGGQVYMDGANMNAQVGLCRPGDFGVDVCHLNLHKTFCIPHGGGGPGVGPIAVASHLRPYLPGHIYAESEGIREEGAVTAAPWGSAGILPISWTYIRLMGAAGLTRATKVAMLNANYIAKRLENDYAVLYKGRNGFIAHECILDLRRFKRVVGVDVTDVAKRLMDYGFHAPTVSFPVIETLMVEPTESESKAELDRFCEAMSAIRAEIQAIEDGNSDPEDNPLKNAPHTAQAVTASEWSHPYSREVAAYPSEYLRAHKYWPPVARIDNAWGDRNLFCSCIPMDEIDA